MDIHARLRVVFWVLVFLLWATFMFQLFEKEIIAAAPATYAAFMKLFGKY